jgi:ATP-dependent Clp protease ATP-binding subunit ClpA
MHIKRTPTRIRCIDTQDQDTGGQGSEPKPNVNDPAGEKQDWKTKYEDAIRHSRDWEKRAKDNKNAAEELKQLKDANLSEQEKSAKRMKELEAENAAYKTAKQQAAWKSEVSKKTGVPAELLRGDSLEDMQALADSISSYLHPKPKAPAIPGQGQSPTHRPASQQTREWVGKLFGN